MSDTESTVQVSPGAVVDHMIGFDGPTDVFLLELLRNQCELADALGGALIRHTGGGQAAEVVAIYPPVQKEEDAPGWLDLAVQAMAPASEHRGSLALPMRRDAELYGESGTDHLVLLPMRNKDQFTGVAAFHVAQAGDALARSRDRLEMTSALINVFELRQALDRRRANMELLSAAMEVQTAVNNHLKFRPAALALVNEVASRFKAERVALGMLEGRYVKVQAMSLTEHFTRKMKLVQDIESAMEECIDQDIEVVHPCPPEQPTITRQTKKLADTHGPTTIISLPLRIAGDEPEPIGVLTIEKPVDEPPTLRDVETLRIASNLVTARLKELYERDKILPVRMARDTRKAAAWAVGSRQTWLKLTALGIAAFLAIAIFVKGPYRVSAPFTVEATERRIISSPFDGELQDYFVEPNDVVIAGETILAVLDTTDLADELAQQQAERAEYLAQADQALSEGKIAEQRVAQARAQQADARIHQIQHQIEQATIISPVSGVVIEGDLRRRRGGTVQRGEELFQVASLENLRAELLVPEARVADLRMDGDTPPTGGLSTSDRPDRRIPFTVTAIEPIAEAVNGKNVFRVRADFDASLADLRIGQEGVAKIEIERRPLIWIWTRDAVNWARMKLWV